MDKNRVVLKKVSKTFNTGLRKRQSFLATIVNFIFNKEQKRKIKVLNDVSFKAMPGEIIGIIGDNGSGKSTLLRIIAGIYENYDGEVFLKGRVVSLINLIVGLKERLTMKDNIFLCCALFGLPRKEVKKIFDNVVEFSELREFLNTKIYQFSEGMKQRLAFSIAVNCNPDILLLDEVFEVGDEEFKQKSSRAIKNIIKKSGSVILVSHDLDLIEKNCDKVIWLENGAIVKCGSKKEIIEEYRSKSRFRY